MSARTFSAQSLAPESNGEIAEAFRSVMEQAQKQTSQYEIESGDGHGADPVSAARDGLLQTDTAESAVMTPASAGAAGAPVDGQAVLRKSFDHAIFVTLVSQIVSGVSQATSTLVRQQ
jgi:hypothetical protein